MEIGRDEAEVIVKTANWAVLKIVGAVAGFGAALLGLGIGGWLAGWKEKKDWEKVLIWWRETPAPKGMRRDLRVKVGSPAPMPRRVEDWTPASGEDGSSENESKP